MFNWFKSNKGQEQAEQWLQKNTLECGCVVITNEITFEQGKGLVNRPVSYHYCNYHDRQHKIEVIAKRRLDIEKNEQEILAKMEELRNK